MTDSEIRVIRFFCPKCGREVWDLVDLEREWDKIKCYSLVSLKTLLGCSDCLLKEIRADREKMEN